MLTRGPVRPWPRYDRGPERSADMELKGKVCLVTGGTKGIGAATAVLFGQMGASVAVVGRRLDDAEAVRTRGALSGTGARFIEIQGDVGRAEDCAACVEKTVKE